MGVFGVLGLAPRHDVEQSVTVAPGAVGAIEVTMATEDITVRSSTTVEEVTVTLRGWSRRQIALTGVQDGRTFVVGPLPDPFWPPRLPEDLHLEVLVPQNYSGTLSVRTSSGKLDLGDVHAQKVAAATASGAITLAGSQAGTATVTTQSGTVDAIDVGGDLTVQTISGHVTALWRPDEARPVLPNMDISTTSGAVSVQLPPDAAFLLDARTMSGAMRSNFPVETNRTTMTGHIGDTNTTITLRTTSGTITVEATH